MNQRYRVTLAYDGTLFHGWQIQKPPEGPELRTVQRVLTDAITLTTGQPITLQGASRTDAGVHAQGQVAHFDADTRIPIDRLASAINARLPEDVEVRTADIVPDNFDACTDAIEKQYRYRLWLSTHRPLGERHAVYHCWTPLQINRMTDAAARILGTHDFAAFATAGHGRQSTIRTVTDCQLLPLLDRDFPELHILVQGTGFLYNMVRIIAGTLVEIGRGRWQPDHIDHLLQQCDRTDAGPTLPPQGLCLQWIRYAF